MNIHINKYSKKDIVAYIPSNRQFDTLNDFINTFKNIKEQWEKIWDQPLMIDGNLFMVSYYDWSDIVKWASIDNMSEIELDYSNWNFIGEYELDTFRDDIAYIYSKDNSRFILKDMWFNITWNIDVYSLNNEYKYEDYSETIRKIPENYCIFSLDIENNTLSIEHLDWALTKNKEKYLSIINQINYLLTNNNIKIYDKEILDIILSLLEK